MMQTSTSTDHVLRIERSLNASRQRVFAAFSTPDALAAWYGPEGVTAKNVTNDFRPGGAYRVEMHTNEGVFIVSGEYIEIDEPNRLVFSWKWDHGETTTRVQFDFEEDGDNTTLRLIQTGFLEEEHKDHHNHGWSSSFDCLAAYLAQ